MEFRKYPGCCKNPVPDWMVVESFAHLCRVSPHLLPAAMCSGRLAHMPLQLTIVIVADRPQLDRLSDFADRILESVRVLSGHGIEVFIACTKPDMELPQYGEAARLVHNGPEPNIFDGRKVMLIACQPVLDLNLAMSAFLRLDLFHQSMAPDFRLVDAEHLADVLDWIRKSSGADGMHA